MTPHRAPGRLAALLVVLVALVAGCTGGSGGTASRTSGPEPRPIESKSGEPSAAVPACLQKFYDQKLDWQPCRQKFTCARLRVPSCYYEFARRYPLPSGELFQGFVPASADKIFESTDVAGRQACVNCHTNVGRNPSGGLNLAHGVAYDQIVNVVSPRKAGAIRVINRRE